MSGIAIVTVAAAALLGVSALVAVFLVWLDQRRQ